MTAAGGVVADDLTSVISEGVRVLLLFISSAHQSCFGLLHIVSRIIDVRPKRGRNRSTCNEVQAPPQDQSGSVLFQLADGDDAADTIPAGFGLCTEKGGDSRVVGRGNPTYCMHLALYSVCGKQHVEVCHLIDTLEAVNRGDDEIVVGREGGEYLADEFVGALNDGLAGAVKRAKVMLIAVEVDQVDEKKVRLFVLEQPDNGEGPRAGEQGRYREQMRGPIVVSSVSSWTAVPEDALRQLFRSRYRSEPAAHWKDPPVRSSAGSACRS